MTSKPLNRRILEGLSLLLVAGVLCVVTAQAQDEANQQQLPAPPPMRTIPDGERAQLNQAKDPKARIRRLLELTEEHLLHAESLAAEQKYNLALADLGNYVALVDDGLRYLARISTDRSKSRDLYKHIELALRAHGPRLIAMRRSTPLEYATRMKEVEDFARDGRTEALNAFYGQTVIREDRPKKSNEDNKAKDIPNKPERQH
jgi:hypothetical protein